MAGGPKDSGTTDKGPSGFDETLAPPAKSSSAESSSPAEFAETLGPEALTATEAAGTLAQPPSAAHEGESASSGPLSQRVSSEHYRIDSVIGKGGMGRVLSARDVRLGRPVALKELLNASPGARRRFEREARITARLQHPGIVPLYEAGHWPNGEPFYAMKKVDGEGLDRRLKDCESLEERLELLPRIADLAEALAYAHSKDVIHRDLKPANVLLGDFGETLLVDWGLARELGRESDIDEDEDAPDKGEGNGALTVVGQAMGTPAYMPPEQARGEVVDKRADVYALGAILYHLLGGKMAYAESSSAQEILSRVLAGPPPPLEALSSELPPELITIVDKAMARDPDDRYQDGSELAEELRRFLAGRLVAAHHYTVRALVGRWIRRHRAAFMTMLVASALLIALGIWSVSQLRQERDRAMEARSEAMEEKAQAAERSRELGLTLAAGHVQKDPLRALQHLLDIPGLDESPTLIEWAREIALEARNNRIPNVITGAGSDHGAFDLSPDGRTIALARHGNEVVLVQLPDKTVSFLPDGALENTKVLRFSPLGTYLAAGDAQGQLRLWTLENGKAPFTLSLSRGLQDLVFSSDERWLVARNSGRITLVDLRNGNESFWPPVHSVHDVDFSPDGSKLAIAADKALLLDLKTRDLQELALGMEDRYRPSRRESFSQVRYAPDGTHLAVADKRLLWIDTSTGTSDELFRATDTVASVDISPDGSTLAAGSSDSVIYVYRLDATVDPLNSITGHNQGITWLRFGADNGTLLSASADDELLAWSLFWSPPSTELWGESNQRVSSTASLTPRRSADGQAILLYDRQNALKLWSLPRRGVMQLSRYHLGARTAFAEGRSKLYWSNGQSAGWVEATSPSGDTEKLVEHGEAVQLIAVTRDEKWLAIAGNDDLRLYHLPTKTSTLLREDQEPIRHLAFVDGHVVGAELKGKVWRWSLDEPAAAPALIADHGSYLLGMVGALVSPDGSWVVTSGIDKRLLFHRVSEAGGPDPEPKVLSDGTMEAAGLAVSPDGRAIAYSVERGVARLFYPNEPSKSRRLQSSDSMEKLMHPVFSPDGKELAFTNYLTGVRVWRDWENSDESRLYDGLLDPSLPRFTSDGRRLIATGKPDGHSAVWHLASGHRRTIVTPHMLAGSGYWNAAHAFVISDWGGSVFVWADDLPTEWEELRSWIHETVDGHSSLPVP